MASTSDLVISQESVVVVQQNKSKIFSKKDGELLCSRRMFSLVFAISFLVLMIVYLGYKTTFCVLYVNGVRNVTIDQKEGNCSTMEVKYVNQTGHKVRTETIYPRSNGLLIAFCVCLAMALLLFLPCNPCNYISCYRRMTCCCKSVSLQDAINRYGTGYINDEAQFQEVLHSGQEGLDLIIAKLKHNIPEVTFDVLKTGSLVERLGKPTVIEHAKSLAIKSILSTDFDVMLTPQTILASAAIEGPYISQTLFSVIAFPNITPGFVWLKLNKEYQESRNTYWRNLCNEFTFPDGSKGAYLSSLKVRGVFVKGMIKIKRKETGHFDFFKKLADKGVSFDVKAQGPAVTVTVESREGLISGCGNACRPTIFYGDFIFAIRCIGWPQEAQEWPMRQRFWPPQAVIQEILTYGYHVVPKPSLPFQDKKKWFFFTSKKKIKNKNQSNLEYEWRLSYSLAEVLLSKHIPPVARACFLALKATMKRHKGVGGCAIASYHLKTVLYWALELNPPEFWSEERIEECFMKLVDTLLDCAKTKHCSHYFMPQVNLMASLQPQLAVVATLMSKIKSNPIKYVSSTSLRCMANVAACYECMCFSHGTDAYVDVY